MKKIVFLFILSIVLLFGKSEEYYKSKYDLYTEKIIELRADRKDERDKKDKLDDFQRQFSSLGARRQAKKTANEIEDSEDKIDRINDKIESYEEKIEELEINAVDDLGKTPKWNVNPRMYENLF